MTRPQKMTEAQQADGSVVDLENRVPPILHAWVRLCEAITQEGLGKRIVGLHEWLLDYWSTKISKVAAIAELASEVTALCSQKLKNGNTKGHIKLQFATPSEEVDAIFKRFVNH